VQLALAVKLVHRACQLLEQLVLLVHKVQQALEVSKVLRETAVQLVLQVLKVFKVLLVKKVQQAHWVFKVLLVQLDQLVLVDS
jgi:hypothetical protein